MEMIDAKTGRDRERIIQCSKCKGNLGKESPYGPNKASIFALGNDKVFIDKRQTKPMKWQSLVGEFPTSVRNDSNYFGFATNSDVPCVKHSANDLCGVEFPRAECLEHFQWDHLVTSGKVPKVAQELAYLETALRDTIVVFPTGGGKTFAAALVMHLFHKLNPLKVSLMVVDRVPLVFQQKVAIHTDTGMRVLPMCGENKSKKMIDQLLDNVFDGLVVTAGCLEGLLSSDALSLSMFSVIVFDECHHAVGQHMYCSILHRLSQCSPSMRPRLMGLSASPFSCTSYADASRSKEELRVKFLGAQYCRPPTTECSTSNGVKWHEVALHVTQTTFIDAAVRAMSDLARRVNSVAGQEMVDIAQFRAQRWAVLRGHWRYLRPNLMTIAALRNDKEAQCRVTSDMNEFFLLVAAVEVCDLLGAQAAAQYIAKHTELSTGPQMMMTPLTTTERSEQSPHPPHSLRPLLRSSSRTFHEAFLAEASTSGRLVVLRRVLTQSEAAGGGTGRGIVFVNTREAANLLRTQLQREFPQMNPQVVVGHGGVDGMDWDGEGQQAATIEKMRAGECRLLVCTNVLEEGLDVPACDLVVRFKGETSLIQFIQSRGRARKEGSTIHMIVTTEEKTRVTQIENQERIMDSVLSQFGRPSAEASAIMRRLDEARRLAADGDAPVDPSEDPAEPTIVRGRMQSSWSPNALCFCVLDDPGASQQDIIDRVIEAFRDITSTEIDRAHFLAGSARDHTGGVGIFEDSHSVLFVNVKEVRAPTLFELCRTWDFVAETSLRRRVPLWLQAQAHRESINRAAESDICSGDFSTELFGSIQTGDFRDRQLFVENNSLVSNWQHFNITQSGNIMFEYTHVSDCGEVILTGRMHFSATSFSSCALLASDRMSSTVSLYLCVTTCPTVSLDGEELDCPKEVSRIVLQIDPRESIWDSFKVKNKKSDLEADLQSVSTNRVLRINLPIDLWHSSGLNEIIRRLPVPVFHARVAITQYTDIPMSLDTGGQENVELKRCCLWYLAVLKENRHIQCTYDSRTMIAQSVQSIIGRAGDHFGELAACSLALQQCGAPDSSPWTNISRRYHTLLDMYQSMSRSQLASLTSTAPPPNYTMVKRVFVTPSRVIPFPSGSVKSSRLLRHFGSQYEFLIVKFVDEDFQAVHDPFSLTRVKSILSHGIDILGMRYSFLFPSSSQSRNQSTYFIGGSKEDVAIVRNHFIAEDNGMKVPKYASRLALFATADTPTIEIPPTIRSEIADKRCWLQSVDVEAMEDLFGDLNLDGPMLTDGAGKVSRSLAERIWKAYCSDSLDNMPSAFQIRLGPMKGILQVCPTLSSFDALHFRPSMVKCSNADKTLCVVKVAKYTPLHLNREIITLLESLSVAVAQGRWDPTDYIFDLQERELTAALDLIRGSDKAHAALRQYLDDLNVHVPNEEVDRSGIDLLTESMWNQLLHIIHQKKMWKLRTKCQILLHVDQGCLLMGVPDEYDCLGVDEVFIQIKPPAVAPAVAQSAIITGWVLLLRNPCLYPGDLRICKAVDKPALHHLVNVVVLSTCTAGISLAASCSGGDLDGDMFGVIFDPKLVPPKHLELAPLEYDRIAQDAKEEQTQSEAQTLEEFFVRVIANESLGKVAHMHLALSDLRPAGACDPLAMKLAESQSLAVDFPKTGVAPLVPKDAKDLIEEKGYPDFMEKGKNSKYASSKSLGKLYRRCRSFFIDKHIKKPVAVDPMLIYEFEVLKEKFLPSAQRVYGMYVSHCRQLMSRFGLRNDSELFLCNCVRWHSSLSADRGHTRDALKSAWAALRTKFQKIFYEDVSLGFGDEAEAWTKASAWYYAAYVSAQTQSSANGRHTAFDSQSQPFLTFPWLVGDILSAMRRKRVEELGANVTVERPLIAPSICRIVGMDMLKFFTAHLSELHGVVSSRLRIVDAISREINKHLRSQFSLESDVSIRPYGSLALCLCENGSDIDVFVDLEKSSQWLPRTEEQKTWRPAQQKDMLQALIFPAVDGLAFDAQVVDAKVVPIIRCSIKDDESKISVDISLSPDGVDKAAYMVSLFLQKPLVLHLFVLLANFCRSCGVIKAALIEGGHHVDRNSASFTLKTSQLHALIISLALPPTLGGGMDAHTLDFVKLTSLTVKILVTKVANVKPSPADVEWLGNRILTFFENVHKLKGSGKWEYVWPIDNAPVEVISADNINAVADICHPALHFLILSSSWSFTVKAAAMLNTSSRHIEIPLSRGTSSTIIPCIEFHKSLLEFASGAQVTFQRNGNKVVVIGDGSVYCIKQLRDEVHKLIRGSSMGFIRARSSAYFMSGSTCVFAEGAFDKDTMLKFVDYFGPCQPQHKRFSRRCPALMSYRSGENDHDRERERDMTMRGWGDYLASCLEEKVLSQLGALSSHAPSLIETLSMTISFGSFYVLKTEEALESSNIKLSLGDLEKAITRNRAGRKQAQRSEFNEAELKKQRDRVAMTSLTNPRYQGDDRSRPGDYKASQTMESTRKRNVASSFYPRIIAAPTAAAASYKDKAAAVETKRQEWEELRKIFIDAGFDEVASLNHSPGSFPNRPDSTDDSKDGIYGTAPRQAGAETKPLAAFKITFSASTSFIVELRLDSSLEMLSVSQKPLSWVHGTVICKRSLLSSESQRVSGPIDSGGGPDVARSEQGATPLSVRLKVQTKEEVPPQSDLFAVAYPKHDEALSMASPSLAPPSLAPPIEIGEDGFARPAASLSRRSRKSIAHIRQSMWKSELRRRPRDGDGGGRGAGEGGTSLSVFLGCGCDLHFSDGDLVDYQLFVDVEARGSAPEAVMDWLQRRAGTGGVHTWVRETVDMIDQLQTILRLH